MVFNMVFNMVVAIGHIMIRKIGKKDNSRRRDC